MILGHSQSMNFKIVSFFMTAVLAVSLCAKTAGEQMQDAQKAAASEQKDLLLVFLGSEWNEKSRELDAEILKKEDFQKKIGEHFVTSVFELPAKKAEAHESLIQLRKDYSLANVPAILVADSAGRPYAVGTAGELNAGKMADELVELKKVRAERDRLFAEAKKVEGVERAKLLISGLKKLPQQNVPSFYADRLKEIEAADEKGKTDYVDKIKKSRSIREEQVHFEDLLREKNYAEVSKSVEAKLSKAKGEDAQRLMLYQVRAFADQGKFAEAREKVKEMEKIDPSSGLGKRTKRYLAMLNNAEKRKARIAALEAKKKEPIASKPVALVSNIQELRDDVQALRGNLTAATKEEAKIREELSSNAKKVSNLEKEIKKLRAEDVATAEALKKAGEEREELAKKTKAMEEVLETHEAMEKRRKEVLKLEEQAAELQKRAEELRMKAKNIKKSQ